MGLVQHTQTFKEIKGTLLNSFYEATATLIPEPNKDPKRKRTSDKLLLY